MDETLEKIIYWTPRILSVMFILFLALFSLDVFEPGLSIGPILIGLFMHNIPSMVLTVILIISWKYEIVGGIAYILAGLLYIVLLLFKNPFEWYMISWALTISGPAFLIGALFLVNWFRKKSK